MNESRISAILGALVVIVVGVMVVNYFRNLRPGTTTPTAVTTESTASPSEQTGTELKHKVAKGDSLWTIAQKYYNNGFRWTEIKEANNLAANSALKEGQELIIPNVGASPSAIAQATPSATPAPAVTTAPQATVRPTLAPTAIAPAPAEKPSDTAISGSSYTVVRGDNLWDIAEKAYGDGFKWKEIAAANNLVNPRVIHAGNTFVIPR